MADVFEYNSGSLFQAISTHEQPAPITDQPLVADLDPSFATSSRQTVRSTARRGAHSSAAESSTTSRSTRSSALRSRRPGTSSWPITTAIKAAGCRSCEQTFGDTWTSQLFVLADYHNVQVGTRRSQTTTPRTKAKFATTPGSAAGVRASAGGPRRRPPERGLRLGDVRRRRDRGGDGSGRALPDAHVRRPVTWRIRPDNVNDVGFFALPGDDAASGRHDPVVPVGLYIPNGRRRQARGRQEFQAFLASPAGCEAQAGAGARRWSLRRHDVRASG